MKVAIIGSRGIENIEISSYIPKEVTEIISGGAKGIDTLAEEYADKHKLRKYIIRPNYEKYSRAAPIVRNKVIVELADLTIAFWDGTSKGTESVIKYAKKLGKEVQVIECINLNFNN